MAVAEEQVSRCRVSQVMALLQSTRDVSPEAPPAEAAAEPAPAEPAPAAPPVRIVLPEPARPQPPKLFLAKPSPIKSDPIKPMQATKLARLPLPAALRRREEAEADSPYSPGSSDFGDLFEPPAGRAPRRDTFDALFDKPARARKRPPAAAKVPVKLNRKKGEPPPPPPARPTPPPAAPHPPLPCCRQNASGRQDRRGQPEDPGRPAELRRRNAG